MFDVNDFTCISSIDMTVFIFASYINRMLLFSTEEMENFKIKAQFSVPIG